MNLAVTRWHELTEERAALVAEFTHWRGLTEKEPPLQPPPLEKHNSQIIRITDQLQAFLDERPIPPVAPADTIDAYAEAQAVIYFAQRVWAFYREKFALRQVDWVRKDLACADELAWGCYKPALDKAKGAHTVQDGELKEPPLVFFDPGGTPFALSRGRSFRPEGVTEEEERRLGPAILQLPIPVVGVPWFQVHHLPAAVAIAHEVGHAVWWDFAVEAPLRDAFRTMTLPPETAELPRRAIWLRWLPELWGDAYAIAALGPAFALGLSAYLSDPVAVVTGEKPVVLHPPAYLRIKINVALLDALGLADEGVAAAWGASYAGHAAKEFEQDIPAVVAALLDTPLPKFGVPLRNVLVPPAAADDIAQRIRKNKALPENPDFRLLYAGATLLFHRDPPVYVAASQGGALADQFANRIREGKRALPLTASERKAQAAADRSAGKRLFEALIGQSTPAGGNSDGD